MNERRYCCIIEAVADNRSGLWMGWWKTSWLEIVDSKVTTFIATSEFLCYRFEICSRLKICYGCNVPHSIFDQTL